MAFNYLMHDRNIYKDRLDFEKIALDYPEFRKHAIRNEKGKIRIDFQDADTLRSLTKILLHKDFKLNIEIPNGFLIPTVPQRLNYILWIEDLLALLPENADRKIRGIDIGTGPCAIFSVLGARKNNWRFVSTESSDEALKWAAENVSINNLQSMINLVKVDNGSFLEGLLSSSDEETFDFCLCNPPFFEEVGEIRKKNARAKGTIAELAKEGEIVADGGEVAFVRGIIQDSLKFKTRVSFYTTMFGKKKSFLQIINDLENIEGISFTPTEFCQGNTVRWGLAWTYLKCIDFKKLQKPKPPQKVKKAKPPMIYNIVKKSEDCTVKNLFQKLQSTFSEIEVSLKEVKCTENYAEMSVASNKNTWSHQRRKRRERRQDKKPEPIKVESSEQSSANATSSITVTASTENSDDVNMEEIATKKRKRESDDDETSKRLKLDSDDLGKTPGNFESYDQNALLYCTLKLRKAKDLISLEINCPIGSNRESMQQVFQFLKNKFISL